MISHLQVQLMCVCVCVCALYSVLTFPKVLGNNFTIFFCWYESLADSTVYNKVAL
jgi:hypothetical protein